MLIWASHSGYEGVVKLLLAREDGGVNAKDNDGKTALMWTSDLLPAAPAGMNCEAAVRPERHRCGCRR
jgi:hypothetical protein